jgi:type I restriction enzyme M protein
LVLSIQPRVCSSTPVSERLKGARFPTLGARRPTNAVLAPLNAEMLGQLIDLISGVALGQQKCQARDVRGRLYEYQAASSPAPEEARRNVLYAALGGPRHGRDDRAFRGPSLQPCYGSGGIRTIA